MDAYKKYEEDCKKIREDNERLLTDFETWLIFSCLTPQTIVKHIANIDFFINEYLLHEDAIEAIEGVHSVSMYLGDWFIKKAMWASPTSIRGNAASIKKFYTFMVTKSLVRQQVLEILVQTIKKDMPAWLARIKLHDQEAFEMDDDI
jgi:site-specific recombinase XerD